MARSTGTPRWNVSRLRPEVIRANSNVPSSDLSGGALGRGVGFGPAPESKCPQLRGLRRAGFAASILVLCALAAGVLLGLPSLAFGWGQEGGEMMHRVHDVGWGAFAVVLVCGSAVTQLWLPERRPAAMQQLIACLVAGGLSMALSGALTPPHLVRGALLAVPTTIMIALHPDRRGIFRLRQVSLPLLGLATIIAVPLAWYALQQIHIQQVDTVSPHGVAFHWGTMATLGLAIAGTMFVASIRAPGWRVPGGAEDRRSWCFGLAWPSTPTMRRALAGRGGLCEIALAIVFVVAAERELFEQRVTGSTTE